MNMKVKMKIKMKVKMNGKKIAVNISFSRERGGIYLDFENRNRGKNS